MIAESTSVQTRHATRNKAFQQTFLLNLFFHSNHSVLGVPQGPSSGWSHCTPRAGSRTHKHT